MISRIMKDFNDTSYALMASQGVTIILIVGFIYFAFKINKLSYTLSVCLMSLWYIGFAMTILSIV
uniref:hypothetical protein n=1 Tax=Aquimarina algiphila TaxID=2047982 RepID=UPI00232D1FAD